MSETHDPWKAVAARPIHDFIDCGDDETTLVFRMDDVKAARAAEATQHRARLAAVEAERDNQYTQAVEATQRALLAEQALANVEAERDKAIDENIRMTNAEIEALRAERDRLKAALSTAAFALDLAGLPTGCRSPHPRPSHEPPTLQRHDHSTGGR